MKLIQATAIKENISIGKMSCKTCGTDYELTLGDLSLNNTEAKKENSIAWRCETCGEQNFFVDAVVESKLIVLNKIRAERLKILQRDD